MSEISKSETSPFVAAVNAVRALLIDSEVIAEHGTALRRGYSLYLVPRFLDAAADAAVSGTVCWALRGLKTRFLELQHEIEGITGELAGQRVGQRLRAFRHDFDLIVGHDTFDNSDDDIGYDRGDREDFHSDG